MIDEYFVKIIAAEMRIAVRCFHLKNSVSKLKHSDVKCTTTKIVDYDCVSMRFIKSVSQRCRGRLIKNTLDFESCDLACLFCCLTLSIVKICRNSNYCLFDFLTKMTFCILLYFCQNHC